MRRELNELHYDMTQFYPMKSVLEQVLGNRTYLKLKETGTLSDWRNSVSKLLSAMELSVASTVEVADQEWQSEMASILKLGREHISSSRSMTDLFAHLSATLARLVFTQIGLMPSRGTQKTVPLRRKYWKLNGVRTVQYVQNATQKSNADLLRKKNVQGR